MLKEIKEKLHSDMGRDIVWTFAIQMLIMLCSFAINKLLANRLSIDDFGQYNVIKRSIQVLSFVMLAGVSIALPRYIPIYRNSNPVLAFCDTETERKYSNVRECLNEALKATRWRDIEREIDDYCDDR